ncbi:MAG TPA: prephenate dehydrogenase/arogenate dehydrogenase family protein [Thermoanaerobaculia bacterium]
MPRVLIAGLGLIGGSIGIRLRERGWRVSYVDPSVQIEEALRTQAADEVFETVTPDAAHSPDLLVLATPVDVAVTILRGLQTESVVTSVCSVLAPLRDVDTSARFVAGHPLAGSEARGLAAARGHLFEGKPWFVDGDEPLVDEMIAECGAVRDRVDPREHDAAVALTSHLPQILSTALAAYLGEEHLRFAGSGLRTFLRLAGSDASVWAPIIDANRENLTPHAEALAKLVQQVIDGDRTAFERARKLYEKL